MNRAERRQHAQGENITGVVGCKFCRSTKGTYVKRGNHFQCTTPDCKGNPAVRGMGDFKS